MADFVQWNTVPQSSGNGEKSNFLKLSSGQTYRIRPLFNPIRFYKYFHKNQEGKLRTAICANPDTCEVLNERKGMLNAPTMRYAAYVIDREDGKVKILEAPQSVFRPIGKYDEISGKNPGSPKVGSDWVITVSGKGLSTKYESTYAGDTPLTKEEFEAAKQAMDNDQEKLKKIFKAHTKAEIEDKLFGDGTPKQQETVPVPQATPSPQASPSVDTASNEDTGNDFDSNW